MQKPGSIRKQFLPNLLSNLLLLLAQGGSTLFLTFYLVKHLQVQLFGIVMLFVAISNYIQIFTVAMNNSAGRELILNFKSGDRDAANRTFNSFLAGNSFLALSFVPLILLINFFLLRIFSIPAGFEKESHHFFLLVALSYLLGFIQSAFAVSSWAMNRFDIRNFSQIVYFLSRAAFILLFFLSSRASLFGVAAGYLMAMIIWTVLDFHFFRVLCPEIRLSHRHISFPTLKRIMATSLWLTVNQMGSFLFYKASLVLANIQLGAKTAGEFAAVLQLSILIQQFGFSLGIILNPSFIGIFAEGNRENLIQKGNQALKLMAVTLILPVALLAGTAKPILRLWLGKDFMPLWTVLVILLYAPLVEMIGRPLFSLLLAFNKIKLPALATVTMGVLNMLLAILFIKLKLGLLGIAMAGLLTLNVKSLLLIPVYSAALQKLNPFFYVRKLLLCLASGLAAGALVHSCAGRAALDSWWRLLAFWALAAILYSAIAFFIVLKKKDRLFLINLLPWKARQGSGTGGPG